MSEDNRFELSRRAALAGLGSVGAASAGVGFGTSAYLSDREVLGENAIVAGELDLRVDWQQLYWGMPYGREQAPYGSAGRPFVNAHPDHDGDGMQSLDGSRYVDGDPNGGMNWDEEDVAGGRNLQESLTCETLSSVEGSSAFGNDNGYDPDSLIHLEDLKPGDCGEVTFGLRLCDNPGYVWLHAESAEGIDDALAEAIEATVWYDLDCDNAFEGDRDRLITRSGNLSEVLSALDGGMPLDPGAYDGRTDPGSPPDGGGRIKIGKVDVNDDGSLAAVDGGTIVGDGEVNFDEAAGAPNWSDGGDYLARDVTVEIEFTEYKDATNGLEPVSFIARITDGEFRLTRIRLKGGGNPDAGEAFETFDDLGERGETSVTETRELETNLLNPNSGQRTAISNVEFFVERAPDGEPPEIRCFPTDEPFCVGFEWCLPTDVEAAAIGGVDGINDLQNASMSFDLGFYTEQCRHNDAPAGPSGDVR